MSAEGVPADEVAGGLREKGVNVSVTVSRDTQLITDVRSLPPLVLLSRRHRNTDDELDRVVEELAGLWR